MDALSVSLKVPDLWQQEAVRLLAEGVDVIVDAPTGSGKTFIFELFVEQYLRAGQAVFTVPTRALANDKLLEWRAAGWSVGIATGDVADNLDAPVVVATLETQKGRILRGEGPRMIVVDEYQMIGDGQRGVNYETALALAPAQTQLLLLSGSVGNAQAVADWLRRLGRKVAVVRHEERPVPLEEIPLEALSGSVPQAVRGRWVRLLAKALMNDLGPVLAFAPRRLAAERLARDLASALPIEDPLILSPEQAKLAGEPLGSLLKRRIAFHHSGLSYQQRAGLVEPLAKAGQLRVVVATMGLAAGINFSLRSVLVTDREYRAGERAFLVRPDELLQMFGRAGRRGLDTRGFILAADGCPALREAKPLILRRSNPVEWPSILAVMHAARVRGESPVAGARALTSRLYSESRVRLGLDDFVARSGKVEVAEGAAPDAGKSVVEILNSEGHWERRGAPLRVPLRKALWWTGDGWELAHRVAAGVSSVAAGNLCRLEDGEVPVYGSEVPLARLGRDEKEGELVLTRWAASRLRNGRKKPVQRVRWTLDEVEAKIVPRLSEFSEGGIVQGLVERNGVIMARLDWSEASVLAVRDHHGKALLNAPTRETEAAAFSFREALAGATMAANSGPTAAQAWYRLGLIDETAQPTRRGVLFSFFNHGEGLAVAVSLEDETYAVEELVVDLANLRAGHRFGTRATAGGRLAALCRQAYRGATYVGYLNRGLPEGFGEGAGETLLDYLEKPQARKGLEDAELRRGDIERALLEWRSLLNHVVRAPQYPWSRWEALQEAAAARLKDLGGPQRLVEALPLTAAQSKRYEARLRFPR